MQMERPTAAKLQIKPGDSVFVAGDEAGLLGLVEPLPDGAVRTDGLAGADACVIFTRDRDTLEARLSEFLPQLAGVRAAWVAYPKGGRSDINRDIIWKRLGELGWRLNSNISLSEEWSAVRLAPA
jgi:hypothetical protein